MAAPHTLNHRFKPKRLCQKRHFLERYPNATIDEFYSDSLTDKPLALMTKKAFLVKGNAFLDWPFQKKSKYNVPFFFVRPNMEYFACAVWQNRNIIEVRFSLEEAMSFLKIILVFACP